MNTTLSDFLNEIQADPDMIQQALTIYLSQQTNDLTPDEMLSELRTSATDTKELEQTRRYLEQTPEAVQQAALAYFEREWDKEVQHPTIRTVFQHAKEQLPVVETAIIAVAAMYVIHLIVTGGVLEREDKTRQKPDGTFETIKSEKFEPFSPIVSGIAKLLGMRKGGR